MRTATDELAVEARKDRIEIIEQQTGRTVAVLDPQEATHLASVLNLAAHAFKRGNSA